MRKRVFESNLVFIEAGDCGSAKGVQRIYVHRRVPRTALLSVTYLDCFFLGETIFLLLQRFSLNRVDDKREEYETRTQRIQDVVEVRTACLGVSLPPAPSN